MHAHNMRVLHYKFIETFLWGLMKMNVVEGLSQADTYTEIAHAHCYSTSTAVYIVHVTEYTLFQGSKTIVKVYQKDP